MVSKLILICLMSLVAPNLFAEEYCSLIVKTIDPRGNEIRAAITVDEANGRKIEVKWNEYTNGGVRVCDLGLSPVDVSVQTGCSFVTVKGVRLSWGEPRLLQVNTYDCPVDVIPQACEFLLRFEDSQKNPIAGVSFTATNSNGEAIRGDRFGRIYLTPRIRSEVGGTVQAPGFASLQVRLPCTVASGRIEQRFRMERIN